MQTVLEIEVVSRDFSRVETIQIGSKRLLHPDHKQGNFSSNSLTICEAAWFTSSRTYSLSSTACFRLEWETGFALPVTV
jgi:ferredoxin-NADP reductase